MKRTVQTLLTLAATVWLGACATLDSSRAPQWQPDAKWALLPMANHSDTPQAGLAAESIVFALMQAQGLQQVARYPAELNPEALFETADRKSQTAALDWAKQAGVRYAVQGSVEEWRYKVGVDGEPAVGISLNIIDVTSGNVVWSGVAGKSGWSRSSIAVTAQKLIDDLLDDADLPSR
ncbi:hypothetical protein [Chitinimonas sp. JJ19]|uniref:hypothetical protein n=1 Tax=Chitinimonas sp. JJ19 TaxID=3109352 RepID=UPI002FFEDD78